MNRQLFFSLIFTSSFFYSCIKEDQMVDSHKPGNLQEFTLGTNIYSHSTFYSFETNKEVLVTENYSWDLGFDSSPDGLKIILNSSKLMYAANTGSTDFSVNPNLSQLHFRFDSLSLYPEHLAIQNWAKMVSGKLQPTGMIIVINLGTSQTGAHLGYKKLLISQVAESFYSLRFANLNGSDENTFILQKDTSRLFTGFSFSNSGKSVIAFPKKSEWDVVFCTYSVWLHKSEAPVITTDEYTPYLVRGVLQNPFKVEAARDTTLKFENINLTNILTMNFEKRLDRIGFRWKKFDINQNLYTIVPNENFAVKTTSNYYFKFRFVSFYNQTGQRGFPIIEYQQL